MSDPAISEGSRTRSLSLSRMNVIYMNEDINQDMLRRDNGTDEQEKTKQRVKKRVTLTLK